MSNKQDVVTIANLGEGDLARQVDEALQEVYADIYDPKKDVKKPRKVVVEITLTPFMGKVTQSIAAYKVTAKLAPVAPVQTSIFTNKLSNGTFVASEFNPVQDSLPLVIEGADRPKMALVG